MKNRFLFLFTVLFVSFSCERPEQIEYEYETNPQYTWGYAAYWGNYYADYGIDNNVLSLTAFTNDLTTDEEGSLVGNGQYLYLEDVFLTPEQKVFTNGTYVVSDSGEAFTIAPGSLYKEDGVEYNTGAFIYYVEENANFSTIKFIVEGSMTISKVGDATRFDFDFTLDDGTVLKGRYQQVLTYYADAYEYETAPVFTSGDAQFWGNYYADYGIDHNVLSLSAYTDSLVADEEGYLSGFGQQLYLEDVFVSNQEEVFQPGVYFVSDSDEPNTIYPGAAHEENGQLYHTGAWVYFIEKDDVYSQIKYIVDGSMNVSVTTMSGHVTRFDFNFILHDDTELNGYFETEDLVYYDKTGVQQAPRQKVRLYPTKSFVPKQLINKQQNKRRNKLTVR